MFVQISNEKYYQFCTNLHKNYKFSQNYQDFLSIAGKFIKYISNLSPTKFFVWVHTLAYNYNL